MRRRLLLVSALLAALAVAAAAFAKTPFTTTAGTLAMDDGVQIAWTLYEPEGKAPEAGWPAIVVLHGLGGNKESVGPIAQFFAAEGFVVLGYDARGHGVSGGTVELASAREVADLRTLRDWLAARPEVSDTRIGAWGISYGGGQTWNALAAGVPLAAAEVVETWTDLYSALWPQNVSKSGVVAQLAQAVIPRSPLIASLAQGAIQGTNLEVIRDLAASRSSLTGLANVTTPVFILQGRRDFVFDITQATSAYQRVAGPKKLYVGDFGHAPSTFPGADVDYVLTQGLRWFDRWLRDAKVDTGAPVELAPQTWAGSAVAFEGLPPTKTTTLALPGRTRIGNAGKAVRTTSALPQAAETFGVSTLRVTVAKLASYPRVIAVLTAVGKDGKETLISQGGIVPHVGANSIAFGNYAVYLPKGSRLRVTIGASSLAWNPKNLVYLPFAGSGSITLGPAQLKLSTLTKPISR